jgi:predicted transcriptional regulator of viral defense system
MGIMGDRTKRDKVWQYALTSTLRKGELITPDEVATITGVSDRVARQTLVNIAEGGWLNRETRSDGSVYYEKPYWLEFHPDDYPGDV